MPFFVWFIFYGIGFFVTLEVTMITGFTEDWTAPVLTSLTMSFMWPLFAAHYTWQGIKAFVRHMAEEFGALHG